MRVWKRIKDCKFFFQEIVQLRRREGKKRREREGRKGGEEGRRAVGGERRRAVGGESQWHTGVTNLRG